MQQQQCKISLDRHYFDYLTYLCQQISKSYLYLVSVCSGYRLCGVDTKKFTFYCQIKAYVGRASITSHIHLLGQNINSQQRVSKAITKCKFLSDNDFS